MLKTYPAIFIKKEQDIGQNFQNLVVVQKGKNIEEAMKNAREMLENVLASYIDEGMALPTPSDILKIEVSDGFVSMIQVDPAPFVRSNKAIRKNVTVPEWLVRLADREKINYSEVFGTSIREEVTSLNLNAFI